eukprot:1173004-Rhodomonas_salina.1
MEHKEVFKGESPAIRIEKQQNTTRLRTLGTRNAVPCMSRMRTCTHTGTADTELRASTNNTAKSNAENRIPGVICTAAPMRPLLLLTLPVRAISPGSGIRCVNTGLPVALCPTTVSPST